MSIPVVMAYFSLFFYQLELESKGEFNGDSGVNNWCSAVFSMNRILIESPPPFRFSNVTIKKGGSSLQYLPIWGLPVNYYHPISWGCHC